MPRYTRSRPFALAVTGALAVLLAAVFAASAKTPVGTALLTLVLLGALAGMLLPARAESAKSLWARGCLVNGMLSAVVGISFQLQDAPWSGQPGYADDIDKAIGPMTGLLWAFAARIGVVALVLAAILFATSYWLFRPPRRHEM
jgi:cbb3-type cytochrome oxidase subunit 3